MGGERDDVPSTADKGGERKQESRTERVEPQEADVEAKINNGARRQRRRNAVIADRISSDRRKGGFCGRHQLGCAWDLKCSNARDLRYITESMNSSEAQRTC